MMWLALVLFASPVQQTAGQSLPAPTPTVPVQNSSIPATAAPLPRPNPDRSGKYHVGDGVSAPILLNETDPGSEIPPNARGRGLCDAPSFSLTVGVDGVPTNVRLIHASTDELHKDMRQAELACEAGLISAVKEYRFKPAMYKGHPVPVEIFVEVNIDWLMKAPHP